MGTVGKTPPDFKNSANVEDNLDACGGNGWELVTALPGDNGAFYLPRQQACRRHKGYIIIGVWVPWSDVKLPVG